MSTELQITKNIHQRLHAVMEQVKYVQKDDKKVNGQYRFVTHDAVSALIRPELVKQGILLIVSVKSHIQEGNRTEVNLELTFCNIDSPDDKITLSAFGYGIDTQDKGPGKAISYAVKYALLKMFCLETGDDPEKDHIEYKNNEETSCFPQKRAAEINKKYDQINNASQYDLLKKRAAEINKKYDQINNASQYDLLINAMIIQIESIETADDANEFKSLMKKTQHINDSKRRAWEMLKSKANELGLSYDDNLKKYSKAG
jgi:ERF superfamily